MRVRVLLNDGPNAFQRFDPAESVLREARHTFAVPDDRDVPTALDDVFAFCNGQDPQSDVNWYDWGNRSVSVGDVVVLVTDAGPQAYACDPVGWSHLDEVPEVMYKVSMT